MMTLLIVVWVSGVSETVAVVTTIVVTVESSVWAAVTVSVTVAGIGRVVESAGISLSLWLGISGPLANKVVGTIGTISGIWVSSVGIGVVVDQGRGVGVGGGNSGNWGNGGNWGSDGGNWGSISSVGYWGGISSVGVKAVVETIVAVEVVSVKTVVTIKTTGVKESWIGFSIGLGFWFGICGPLAKVTVTVWVVSGGIAIRVWVISGITIGTISVAKTIVVVGRSIGTGIGLRLGSNSCDSESYDDQELHG